MPAVTISVEDRHIRQGIPVNSECCAVALAVKEATGLLASIGVEWIEVKRGGRVLMLPTPPEVADFVVEYDSTYHLGPEQLEPFSFALELPE